MRGPANPCKWFGDGGGWGDQESFTYAPGPKPFYFAPGTEICAITFSHWIPISVMLFANNEQHAKDIIERMLSFRLEVHARHVKYLGHDDYANPRVVSLVTLLLDNKDKWEVMEIPTNQFYGIGWADNDHIL